MATVKGPLFSLDASGTVGGSVVFSKWKGRSYVRRHAVPANPKSAGQLGVRAMLRFLTQDWVNLTDGQQVDWEKRAEVTNISPFNAFVSYNQTRFGLNLGPSKLDPATEENMPGVLAATSVTARVRSLLVGTEIITLQNNWAIYIYRSLADDIVGARTEVVYIIPGGVETTYAWLDFPLTPGTEYWYTARAFSDDGQYSACAPAASGTPTA